MKNVAPKKFKHVAGKTAARKKKVIPKHNLPAQVRKLGADSLLPPTRVARRKVEVADVPRKAAAPEVPRYADINDLLPNEPYLLIKGRDPLGEMFNMAWCLFRRYQIQMGLVPDTAEERAQLAAGFKNSTEMQIFARDYAVKLEHDLMKFDKDGNAIARAGVKIPLGKKGS